MYNYLWQLQLTVSGVAGSRSPSLCIYFRISPMSYCYYYFIAFHWHECTDTYCVYFQACSQLKSSLWVLPLKWGWILKGLIAAGEKSGPAQEARPHTVGQRGEKRGWKQNGGSQKKKDESSLSLLKIKNAHPSRGACSTFLCVCRRGIDFINVRSFTWMNLRFFHISKVTETFPLLSKCLTALSA